MEMRKTIEEIKFVINRFDHYYESINNKGNVYLTLNTFGLAGLISGYGYLRINHYFGSVADVLFTLTVLVNLASIALTLWALKPYLISKKFGKKRSLLFFGDVSLYDEESLLASWENINDRSLQKDLLRQVHNLSCGLRTKYNSMLISTWFMMVEIFLAVILAIVLIYNK